MTNRVIRYYGLSQNSQTKDYIIVMKYAGEGDLHKYLNNRLINLTWKEKLLALQDISNGLAFIHQAGLMHCDFHGGNLLVSSENVRGKYHIGDLGLCRPINQNQEGETGVYGV